jgi:hypothetical protein
MTGLVPAGLLALFVMLMAKVRAMMPGSWRWPGGRLEFSLKHSFPQLDVRLARNRKSGGEYLPQRQRSASIFKRCAYFPSAVTSFSPATELSWLQRRSAMPNRGGSVYAV